MTERAAVTRAHRVATLVAFGWGDVVGTKNSLAKWVETGVHSENPLAGQTLPMTAQAIADAEARGRAESSAEVSRPTAELAELKSQANEYRRHPFPTVASAELERDVKRLRYTLQIAPLAVEPHRLAKEALSRIAAALGLGSEE
jgi:hypothetical protein